MNSALTSGLCQNEVLECVCVSQCVSVCEHLVYKCHVSFFEIWKYYIEFVRFPVFPRAIMSILLY